ncbi:MAG: hypothetical protein A2509_04790 [Candidatus Edwardsbacteria bacterium RIFOXYD12_FULL_50_11]|uniref:DUF2007 domain-containing protein n=1 Tax=Candidatus Edwardsbacteria bacterium GWF2_54_11 TaxID=1817851 RepID=A0A1F5RHA7_9BACT|nr:MAG: hypothetical protein A2502_00935 [Candidatus Edwardsbacteria bacterium RifOxyC12_full_54_24]OGF06135.1 MAG: hypothetical protein A2273_11245 [Candidatus Edwardsbacteria bacterium RifOxyA12_full_54_48]OGF12598.1 MAG: hypothetical protein A3K15_02025 [Candidatus Edwardsbacteria bacterium GWE2_54_12]OGF13865.1 MAG: hypothetical protein A2024_10485 [Candidatus Edwardsbacteria bacterium GWF2_54_11]OGF17807.1 MAG: hypothetical protein A2509_04790 [Candidatus Edwardsbacteria bacterium RIFOXYD1
MTPFCPNCRTEYREGFKNCSDCGSDLMAALPPEADNREEVDSDLLAVYDAPDQMSALALSSLLNDNGIRNIIKSEQIPMYDGVARMLFPRWGRVMVMEHQYQKARELIDGYLSGEALAEDEPPPA